MCKSLRGGARLVPHVELLQSVPATVMLLERLWRPAMAISQVFANAS